MYAIRSYYEHGLSKLTRNLRLKTIAAVHIARKAEHQLDGFITVCELDQMVDIFLQIVRAVIGFNALRGDAQRVTDRDANRITSYNVCYTKLLRPALRESFFAFAQRPFPSMMTATCFGSASLTRPNARISSSLYVAIVPRYRLRCSAIAPCTSV